MGIFKSLDNLDAQKPETLVSVHFNTVEETYDTVLEKIQNGTFNDNEIQKFIFNNYELLLNYNNFMNADSVNAFISLWLNPKFLRNFIFIITECKEGSIILFEIKTKYRTTVNKIAYSCNKNDEAYSLLQRLIYYTDYDYIKPLTSIIDEETALLICLSIFSADNPKESIHRLNEIIVNSEHSFSINDIVYIYSRFYLKDFSLLWNYTMIDIYNNLNSNQQNNNDAINFALINILNSMISTDIYKVLYQYYLFTQIIQNITVRFHLKNLSDEFERINKVIEELNEENIFV